MANVDWKAKHKHSAYEYNLAHLDLETKQETRYNDYYEQYYNLLDPIHQRMDFNQVLNLSINKINNIM